MWYRRTESVCCSGTHGPTLSLRACSQRLPKGEDSSLCSSINENKIPRNKRKERGQTRETGAVSSCSSAYPKVRKSLSSTPSCLRKCRIHPLKTAKSRQEKTKENKRGRGKPTNRRLGEAKYSLAI